MEIKWGKIFDWTIIGAAEPVLRYTEYSDAGMVPMMYEVRVLFRHHGECSITFVIDEDKLGLMPREVARNRAYAYYYKTCEKIRRRNQAGQGKCKS
ncbi:MAG: hypothetical protein LBF28_02715 [Rickettsiales bacterium]|jgi:hypothetical protein|nr:hypothetical protein [Rickettsiales bacterium]